MPAASKLHTVLHLDSGLRSLTKLKVHAPHASSSTPGCPPTDDLVHLVQRRSIRMFTAAMSGLATESGSNPNAHQGNRRTCCGGLVA